MKPKYLLLAVLLSPVALMAQQQPRIANLRSYDQRGINVFEDPKDTAATFDGLKVKFGAGFTQQFQNLKHKNPDALNNNVGAYSGGVSTPGNKLKVITAGFQTAQANLYFDVQLADGIRLNVTSYLSSKHHNETWVKGGYIQFDKLPFKGQIWTDIMKVTTIKVGHYEVNYGDAHFRRSDGGQALYNPFMEGNIMDAYSTEIGGEIYVRKNGWFGMVGVTNGMIKGNVDSLYAAKNSDGDLHKSPSILLKAGVDKKVAEDVRVRVSASYYGNQSSGGNVLYGGDRSGSNYQYVMEENSANPSSTTGAGTPLAFSGRFNPGFSKKVNAVMLNGFLKAKGLELFGTYETASGRTASETSTRNANQYAVDAVYRFLKDEKLFIGARYNGVSARLANNAAGTGAGAITYTGDVKVNRFAAAAGWFLTRNILLKGEYVIQQYKYFPVADYRAGGQFNGYVIEAVVGF
jgi:urease beta subunit